MGRFIVLASMCCLTFAQVFGDDVDELRAHCIDILTLANEATKQSVGNANSALLSPYFSQADHVYQQDGDSRILAVSTLINGTAAILAIDADTTAKITCINETRDASELALQNLSVTYTRNTRANYMRSTAKFQNYQPVLSDIKVKLSEIFQTNLAIINACEIQPCFENCLADADQQFAAIDATANEILTVVKSGYEQFNPRALSLIEKLVTDSNSVREGGTMIMEQC